MKINMARVWFLLMGSFLYFSIYSANYPDIDIHLEATIYKNNTLLKLTCSSKTTTLGCTAELLTNQRTYDQIRGDKSLCYHTGGKCTQQSCTCSDDCKQFSLNMTSLFDLPNTTFGCNVNVEVNKVTFKASISIKYLEKGFAIINKKIIPINGSSSNQDYTTQLPKLDNSEYRYDLVIAISVVVISVVSLLSFGIKITWKLLERRKDKRNKNENQLKNISLAQSCQLHQSDNVCGISLISDGNCGSVKFDSAATSGDSSSHSRAFSGHHQFDSTATSGDSSSHSRAFSGHHKFDSTGLAISTSGDSGSHSRAFSGHHKFESAATSGYKYSYPRAWSGHQQVDSAGRRNQYRRHTIDAYPRTKHAQQDSLNMTSCHRHPNYEHQAPQDSLNKTSYHRQPNYEHQAQQDNLNTTSIHRQPKYEHQAPQSSKTTPSHVHTQEYRYTQAPKGSRKKLPSNQDLAYQAPQNSKNAPSLIRTREYRHTQAPQKSKNAPSLFRTPEYRHTQDQNSTMNNSNVQVCYSALPGYRSSTSTHSSASGEGLNIYSIQVENRVLLHGQDLNESNA